MNDKDLIVKNLRAVIGAIKNRYRQILKENPLWQQWAYLRMQEAGMDWKRE